MTIEVKREHIDRGVRASPCSCPIALALRAAGLQNPFVTLTQIHLNPLGDNTRTVQIPDDASEFAAAFDEGRFVQPFTFELPIPEPTHAN